MVMVEWCEWACIRLCAVFLSDLEWHHRATVVVKCAFVATRRVPRDSARFRARFSGNRSSLCAACSCMRWNLSHQH